MKKFKKSFFISTKKLNLCLYNLCTTKIKTINLKIKIY